MALKLHIKKAFDTMDWVFILDVLAAFGFDNKFITWVSTVLASAKLPISVNGKVVGYFSCK